MYENTVPASLDWGDAAREQARLDALARHSILDSPPEEGFDRLTKLARDVFNVPIATIAFLDGHRQWFKSQQGLITCESDRSSAFCNITIQLPRQLIIPDAQADERFAKNELVIGPPHIRFYAGQPLRTRDGHAIGTICAMGTQPRSFNERDQETLADLGALATELLDLRRRVGSGPKQSDDRPLRPDEVMRAGRIVYNSGRLQIRCTVRNHSKTGATAQVITTAKIPDRVAL